jgi:hypothetical protein
MIAEWRLADCFSRNPIDSENARVSRWPFPVEKVEKGF